MASPPTDAGRAARQPPVRKRPAADTSHHFADRNRDSKRAGQCTTQVLDRCCRILRALQERPGEQLQ